MQNSRQFPSRNPLRANKLKSRHAKDAGLANQIAASGSTHREAPRIVQSSRELGRGDLTCMLLACDATAAVAASPPASASLRSCSAISRAPRSASACLLFPRSLIGRGASLFNRRAILQRVEGAGGETLTTINELRACGCRSLPLPPSRSSRRPSPFPFYPSGFRQYFLRTCSLCLPPRSRNVEGKGTWSGGHKECDDDGADRYVTVGDIGHRLIGTLPIREKIYITSAAWFVVELGQTKFGKDLELWVNN